MLALEERLHDVIDSLVTECVVAYFDRATAELSYRARHDPLTDLLNHAAFTRELEHEVDRAERYGTGITLVFFDFDDFKQINDTRGHQIGDLVLRRVAQLLRSELRRSDFAGRMGGDEFVVCIVEADEHTGSAFVARLKARIVELGESDELPMPVSISAGMTHYPGDGADAHTLFAVADARLYEAKRASAA